MADHYMVKESAFFIHDVHADRTTGYPHFLPQLSLVRGEYWYVLQSQS